MNSTTFRALLQDELAPGPRGTGAPPVEPQDASAASDDPPATRAGELAHAALMLLPGALIVFTGFNAGGYFPTSTALAVVLLTQILLVRIVQAQRPFAGLTRSSLIAIVGLALYALMTLASAVWSHASSRALIEFDRAWLYLLILLLYATIRPSAQNLRWFLRGLVLGIALVCLAGLVSRVLPHVWHTAPNVANQRLSYPVSYWNTLGLLAALGIVLALHLACTLSERRLVQILAAALVPLLAATLFFTFSRGAMAASAIGLVVYVLVARPRGLLSGALASVPGTVVLILVAYHANLLDTVEPTTPAAVSQGHRVALVAGVCALLCGGLRLLLAIVLDPRLRRFAGRSRTRRPGIAAALGAGSLVLVAAVLALALGLPHTLAHDWNRFISGAPTHGSSGDLRQRLSDPSNDGRTDLWRVALHGGNAAALHGRGAGMYQTLWDRQRPRFAYVINAHSLYLQAFAELGVPGLLLLLIALGAILGALAARVRTRSGVQRSPNPQRPLDHQRPLGAQRSLYGALLAAGLIWALRAGVDWDWEMPVVTLGFFAAGGLALSPRNGSAPNGSAPGWVPARGTRMALGLLCCASLVLPVLIIGSQRHLADAERALYASHCNAASSAALSSIGWLDVRPEPYEILGLCDVQRGLPRQGVAAMRQAVHYDPGSWETYYALALAQAAAGIDPRPNAEKALRMNPLEPLTRQAATELNVASPTEWVKRAARVRASALASNDLSLVPS